MKILSIKSRRQGASTANHYASAANALTEGNSSVATGATVTSTPQYQGILVTDSTNTNGWVDYGKWQAEQQWKSNIWYSLTNSSSSVPNPSQEESPDFINTAIKDRDAQIIANATDDKLLDLKNLIDIELVKRGILKVDKTSTIEI